MGVPIGENHMKKLIAVSFLGAAFLFANTSFAEDAKKEEGAAPAKKEAKKAKKGEEKKEAPPADAPK